MGIVFNEAGTNYARALDGRRLYTCDAQGPNGYQSSAEWNHRPTEQTLVEALRDVFACIKAGDDSGESYYIDIDAEKVEEINDLLIKAKSERS